MAPRSLACIGVAAAAAAHRVAWCLVVKEVCIGPRGLARRRAERCVAPRSWLLAAILTFAFAAPAFPQQIKGEVSAAVENGFVRIVFTLAEDVEPQVCFANGIVVIGFQRPVDINLEKLSASVAGYVSAARRDPDGKGIRIALARKVTVNTMTAGERLFVDLLPDTWTGLPPGLPREVIDELARRAREAEKSCGRSGRWPARSGRRRSGCGSPASLPSPATSLTCRSSSASPPITAKIGSR
jgi:hypothetical protein